MKGTDFLNHADRTAWVLIGVGWLGPMLWMSSLLMAGQRSGLRVGSSVEQRGGVCFAHWKGHNRVEISRETYDTYIRCETAGSFAFWAGFACIGLGVFRAHQLATMNIYDEH